MCHSSHKQNHLEGPISTLKYKGKHRKDRDQTPTRFQKLRSVDKVHSNLKFLR